MFTAEVRRGVLWRDAYVCGMEGAQGCPGGPAFEVNHRRNRGTGGGGDDTPNNACAIHTVCNGRLESDSVFAVEARRRGVKLITGDDPEMVPIWSALFGQWLRLRGGAALLTGCCDAALSARDERWLNGGLVQGG